MADIPTRDELAALDLLIEARARGVTADAGGVDGEISVLAATAHAIRETAGVAEPDRAATWAKVRAGMRAEPRRSRWAWPVPLSGLRAILDPDAWVSMNLWGFTPSFFDELRLQSQHFGQREADGAGVEFLLSEAVNAQMMAGNATVRLLPAHEGWFGLTHPADRPTVQARLDALTSEGTYPARFDLHPPG